jgi:hypothetical protein
LIQSSAGLGPRIILWHRVGASGDGMAETPVKTREYRYATGQR